MNSVYTLGTITAPRRLNVALFPDYRTKGDLLRYLRETGLSGWPHQSNNLHHLHITLAQSEKAILPMDFPQERMLDSPINLSNSKWQVKPFTLSHARVGTSIQMLFPGVDRLRVMSNKVCKQLKIAPMGDHVIFHMTLSHVQEFHPKSKQYEKCRFKRVADYYKLPAYEGRMILDTIRVNYDNR